MTIYDINKAMLELFDENGELVDIEAFAELEMARETEVPFGKVVRETAVKVD